MPPTGFFRGYCRFLLRPLRGATRKYRDIGRVEPNYVRLELVLDDPGLLGYLRHT